MFATALYAAWRLGRGQRAADAPADGSWEGLGSASRVGEQLSKMVRVFGVIAGLLLLWPFITIASIVAFPGLAWLSLLVLAGVGLAEYVGKVPGRSALRAASVLWLAVVTPLCGLLPLYVLLDQPFYNAFMKQLLIFGGISLTGLYCTFLSFLSAEVCSSGVDHPSPPLTEGDLWVMTGVTLGLAAAAVVYLYRSYTGRRSRA
jgi:hypothetical protein